MSSLSKISLQPKLPDRYRKSLRALLYMEVLAIRSVRPHVTRTSTTTTQGIPAEHIKERKKEIIKSSLATSRQRTSSLVVERRKKKYYVQECDDNICKRKKK